jgi:hypothetical protein
MALCCACSATVAMMKYCRRVPFIGLVGAARAGGAAVPVASVAPIPAPISPRAAPTVISLVDSSSSDESSSDGQ